MATVAAVALAAATLAVMAPSARASSGPRVGRQPAECLQGRLQVAIEQGGGLAGQVPATFGYTFLVVNIGATACTLRGYPYEVIFSAANGGHVKVDVAHRASQLYAQPRPARVVLRPGGLASFGLSYRYGVAPSSRAPREPASCHAKLLDFRLPAAYSHMFSYEFPVRFDACVARRLVDVTPVEVGAQPQP